MYIWQGDFFFFSSMPEQDYLKSHSGLNLFDPGSLAKVDIWAFYNYLMIEL